MLELDGSTLTYAEFRRRCLVPNCPAIIRRASRNTDSVFFNLTDILARLSPQTLVDTIGPETRVPVYSTFITATVEPTETKASSSHTKHDEGVREHAQLRTSSTEAMPTSDESDDKEEKECCREVPLATVLESWTQKSSRRGASASTNRVHYLKDWHLQEALERLTTATITTDTATTTISEYGGAVRGMPACSAQRRDGVHGGALYRVPDFLGADWMDSFCRHMQAAPPHCKERLKEPLSVRKTVGDEGVSEQAPKAERVGFGNNTSDYRFAYLGPVGSWTPLHCDVFGTYSWSFNVCGDKLWFFPTPAGNAYLHAHLPPFFPTPPDMRVLTGFEMEGVVQHPGDLVFVPARFYHQVHNITGEVFTFHGSPSQHETTFTEAEAERGSTTSALVAVGPLTMALNHNWCNVFNIEPMTRAFLDDAHRLVSHLSVSDLEIICDTDDVAVWRDYVDTMLHNGTNWSYASMTCFLEFCLRAVEDAMAEMMAAEDEREMAVALLRRLLSDVTASHTKLFTT